MGARIKFCGITRATDALAAVALGVDALGFVFHRASPRYISPNEAAVIARELPPFISKVGLFVNAPASFIEDVVQTVKLDVVQYHGDESPEDCRLSSRPWIKALRVRQGLDLVALSASYSSASAILYDAYDETLYGGVGKAFDWTLLGGPQGRPRILAGGLTPHNVAQAIRLTRPYAVDVSGGIEAIKGIKDHDKMAKFVAEVRRVDCEF